MVMMALVSAVAGATYAQEAIPPAQATAQQAAPAGTTQAPAPTSPAPAATPSNTPQTKTPATTAAATTSAGPSPDLLKTARQEGYQVKVRRGTTYFCKSITPLGTRFATENCYNQDQLEMVLEKQQAQRDALQQNVCAGGGACGGGK